MQQIPEALAALRGYNQFILWTKTDDGKKLPINGHTLKVAGVTDRTAWLTAEQAEAYALQYGAGYSIGFVFMDSDPFFFLDIDKCLTPTGWGPVANDLLTRLNGAAAEVSQSGTGLHIIGQGDPGAHGCRNNALGLELYTNARFVALTGANIVGDAGGDYTAPLREIIPLYFPKTPGTDTATDWTTEPVPEWNGPKSDAELIEKALRSAAGGSVFGSNRATFKDLWNGDADVLARSYPDARREYDASGADAALAQHLAFWTGKNCERIKLIMESSALVREKWDREDYLPRTILNAVSRCEDVYNSGVPNTPTTENNCLGPKLRATSEAQRNLANSIRHEKLSLCVNDAPTTEALTAPRGPATTARFWIENKTKTPGELAAMLKTTDKAFNPFATAAGPEVVSGMQYLGADLQIEYFSGCVYIQNLHRIFTPSGALLKTEQFNATYGGYVFQLDETGDKTTRRAWEAFTESQIIRHPKAETTIFKPDLATGEITTIEGRTAVNVYVPFKPDTKQGDPAPFIEHLRRVLPIERDREILLSYMAACIQHKGIKFQWAPLLQGTEGNGKTLFTRCVAYAIGKKYTHYPKASDLDNKFNGWLMNKLFIGVEDIFVPDNRREILETLKPMITGGDGIEIQLKGADQITTDICANFIFNSNHKEAIRKTENDRRFAIFFCAQQEYKDLKAAGMVGDYFPKLYHWLNSGGYGIVTDYLSRYDIPHEFNPATGCHRAPETSSTAQAVEASLGGIEQEIIEAVEEHRPGFCGGWVSSMAMERLLHGINAARKIPHNKRREILAGIGYILHPGLTNGRVNNPTRVDGGKPKLFIKEGHRAINLTNGSEITAAYENAQAAGERGEGVAVFGGVPF